MREVLFCVYILASKSRRLYTGMTNNLVNRIGMHKSGAIEGFTNKYKINRLVYYETFKYVKNCIDREKQIKAWTRVKRVALIEANNPTWEDLAADWFNEEKQVPRAKAGARDDNSIESSLGTAKAVPFQGSGAQAVPLQSGPPDSPPRQSGSAQAMPLQLKKAAGGRR